MKLDRGPIRRSDFSRRNLLAHALNLRRLLFEIRIKGVYFLLLLRNYRLQDPTHL